jgi:large subunit ribosomal protein L3
MCSGLIGKKLRMIGMFTPEGRYIPVTVVKVGPCIVTQVKSEATDGYKALQLGFSEKKVSKVNKPLRGHFAKSGGKNFAHLREFPVDDPESFSLGQVLKADLFSAGERIDVTGTTKGRGFSGVVKRHGFHRGRMTHGSKSHRIPGSIGCSAYPAKVIKGKKMPGQHGNKRKTVRNLEIFDVRPDDNIIMVRGPIPGSETGIITIKKAKPAGTAKS